MTRFTVFFSGFVFHAFAQQEPLVETSLGSIKGSVMTSSSGRSFLAFRGIPYAKPPIGPLRFRDPVAVEPWETVLDATREGPMCLQNTYGGEGIAGTEDCLSLNVYTHGLGPEEGSWPVMVWIHGGGFFMGSGNGETDLYGPNHLMDKDIVLVTINYRLGSLGFFSTGSKEAPGNYGLLDQLHALKWVQDHIRHFGGNPDSVTIFGESAGAASVHFHVLSPLSKGLFHRAIIQSGTSLCPWAMSDSLTKFSLALLSQVGCQSADDPVECLRTKEAEDLLLKLKSDELAFMVYGPRVDSERENPFLPAHPAELMKSGKYNHVPIIIGVTKNEGIDFMEAEKLLSSEEKQRQFGEPPYLPLGRVLTIPDHVDLEGIAQRAMEIYLDKERPFTSQIPCFQMVSDFTFFRGTNDVVQLQAANEAESIFYYLLTHRNQFSFVSVFGDFDTDYGVSHGDDLLLMFSNNMTPPLVTAEDKKMSQMIVDLWTSFASQGCPKSDMVSEWKPTSKEGTRYLDLNTEPQLIDGEMPFHHRLQYWDHILSPSTHKDEL